MPVRLTLRLLHDFGSCSGSSLHFSGAFILLGVVFSYRAHLLNITVTFLRTRHYFLCTINSLATSNTYWVMRQKAKVTDYFLCSFRPVLMTFLIDSTTQATLAGCDAYSYTHVNTHTHTYSFKYC